MSIDRLNPLAHQLDLLQEQIAGKAEAKIFSRFEDKVLLERQIKKLKQEMQPIQQEYWPLVARSVNQIG